MPDKLVTVTVIAVVTAALLIGLTETGCCGPKRHILLGLQMLIGCLVAVVGFYMIGYARAEGVSGSVLAGICYFLAGCAAVGFSILLISGIGIVYLRVL